ncbi:MAG: HAD family phosphatase [Candidatus Pacearchaeota archaeon]|nr:HAD family phosphatase [Candidatus Pacearchaeota archaeon]
MKKIKWVVSDYGGVIAKKQNKQIIARICQLIGISTEDFDPLYRKERDSYDAGLMDRETYWRHLLSSINKDIGSIDMNTIFDLDIKGWLDINKETTDYLSSIKPKVNLALLSNMPKDILPDIHKQTWYKLFDISILSCEEKICKPDNRIYDLLLTRIQSEAQYVLFIDDLILNVKAARQNGINAIQFIDCTSMKKEIEENYFF